MITLLLTLALTGDLTPIQPQQWGQPSQPIPQPFQGRTPTDQWRDQMNTYNQMNENLRDSWKYNQDQTDKIYHPNDD